MTEFHQLPIDLPVPVDDGACDHLTGLTFPAVSLHATAGRDVDLSALAGRTVLYIYPRTGTPGVPSPQDWDSIPGARGCTPQSCAFRDHHAELQALGARVFGLSTQTTPQQAEAAARLHLPFPLLSDMAGELGRALRLPTFEVEGQHLLRRVTLIVKDGLIEKVFYPVFPPDQNAANMMGWLRQQPA
ncbi:peroxiredoxin [Deinococcus puniceus]|uniref:BcpB protein n=1 Tax=Deinococcus puniceus TaxID=1182568 RepID=A0A172TC98_9DEIO|nr:peroxiredoxin [Deinococcus puniceus]ANE44576.1 BcpB protein [Deinococcus puniceus]